MTRQGWPSHSPVNWAEDLVDEHPRRMPSLLLSYWVSDILHTLRTNCYVFFRLLDGVWRVVAKTHFDVSFVFENVKKQIWVKPVFTFCPRETKASNWSNVHEFFSQFHIFFVKLQLIAVAG
jgi:hypothetical protein